MEYPPKCDCDLSNSQSHGKVISHHKSGFLEQSVLFDIHKKRSLWQRLTSTVAYCLKRGRHLTEAYAVAAVEKELSEANKTNQEAAEITARKDLTRQQEVREFASMVDSIFADDGLPAGAKVLKLAKLLENNPQLGQQVEAAKGIFEQLSCAELMDESS